MNWCDLCRFRCVSRVRQMRRKGFVVVGAPLCVVLRIKDSDRRAFEQDAALGAVTAVRVLFAGVVQQLLGGKSREPSLPVAPLEPARNKKDGERNNLSFEGQTNSRRTHHLFRTPGWVFESVPKHMSVHAPGAICRRNALSLT